MRHPLAVANVLLVLLIAGGRPSAQARQPPQSTTGTAAVSGVVTDAQSGAPVPGASVQILARNQNRLAGSRLAVTDARGRYVFVNLASTAEYDLFVSKAGYSGSRYKGGWFRLTDAEWKRDGDVSLLPQSWIGGRVQDERGEPVVGVAVQLFSLRWVGTHQVPLQNAVAMTDDRGVYRFFGPDAGDYFLAVLSVQSTLPVEVPDGSRTTAVGGLVNLNTYTFSQQPEARGASIDADGKHRLVLTNFPTPPDSEQRRAYAPVFYPGARALTDAQAITVEAGRSVANVDFQLTPVATATVSGQVTGLPAVNMLLRLMAPDTEYLGFGCEVATTIVERDGRFTFLNVPVGSYTLLASARVAETSGGAMQPDRVPDSVGFSSQPGLSGRYPGGPYVLWRQSPNGSSAWGRLSVSVGAANVSGLELPLHPAATVRGHLAFDDPSPPTSIQGYSVVLAAADADLALGAPNSYTRGTGDGSFAFTITDLLGGRYLFDRPFLFGSQGWRIESVTSRGVDITDSGIDGTPGLDVDDVVVTLTKAGAGVSGRVVDEHGQAANGTVVLFPADPKRWADSSLIQGLMQSTDTVANGQYQLTLLPPGDYDLVAVSFDRDDAWLDPRFLAAAAPKASRVSLAVGHPVTKDLQLTEVVVK